MPTSETNKAVLYSGRWFTHGRHLNIVLKGWEQPGLPSPTVGLMLTLDGKLVYRTERFTLNSDTSEWSSSGPSSTD